jgi:hypothetical protein
MEYFILQFDSLSTMRNVVNKFNNYGSTDAKLVAMNYTRPRSSPSSKSRIPTIKNFKVIDINGTESQRQLVIDALSALTHHDAFQILDHQPSPTELHFYVTQTKFVEIIKNTWAIPVGSEVLRIGPASYNKTRFHNRNTWVGKSTTASTLTNAKLLTNLDAIGVKDVYRNSDTVFLVFDTEDHYHSSVTRSISMGDLNLDITPYTQFSSYGIAHRRTYAPTKSAPDQTKTESDVNHQIDNPTTSLTSTISPPTSHPSATGSNAIPVSNRPNRS